MARRVRSSFPEKSAGGNRSAKREIQLERSRSRETPQHGDDPFRVTRDDEKIVDAFKDTDLEGVGTAQRTG
ncbi:unnamed protein product [Lasius platythorax]|uniref:Uncharacterized protein n=1 Tax=Lasius platythorax TaxID=488582 RepID=A0AAV2NNS1_9HYME